MKNGIKKRLVWSYLLLIILTVLMFESIILSSLRLYYLGGVKQTLRDQGTMFISFYEQELLKGDLDSKAQALLNRYNFLVNTQVQIINTEGQIVADTFDQFTKSEGNFEDVNTALTGETGYWTGNLNGESVLTVAQPIMVDSSIIGVIRFTTSMVQINTVLKQNAIALLGIGVIVILLAAFISYFIARTITNPLSRITLAAEQMASGKYYTRIPKGKNDEIGKLADTLNFMAEEIERHEKLKNEFIASVSHELRTPLTSVKGWAITLESMTDEPLFKEGLEIISTESDRLSMLLGDLLDLSSLSSGKVPYKFTEVSLQKLLQQVSNQLAPRAERQGLKLITDIPLELISLKKGDENRLKQVFINLLDNGLKFTPQGGRITLKLTQENDMGIIKVMDTGMGIPVDELQLVKEKFHKGKSKGSGTGLGLAICQEIVLAHKGTFDLMSEEGKGTSVIIKLPL
ncbi:HAMP domain-containing sensor histidine kinase [Bacillus sp. 31A1R]|uniref:histidine kinase n=1 Tax=Robertmurraya mangrovi TaxID=3098077 RepID=A0ABU5J3P0_9BACI|nr:HAMP domain-containing sensor histidine kinase [Bacillus sp. 31A1R]MDZ5473962.1 HAMP domain-containing sensor histidine kinase [Bacillus sp. 31A1R]